MTSDHKIFLFSIFEADAVLTDLFTTFWNYWIAIHISFWSFIFKNGFSFVLKGFM